MFKSSLVESLVVFVTTGIFIVIIATGGLGYDTTIPKESEVESVIVKEADRDYLLLTAKILLIHIKATRKELRRLLNCIKKLLTSARLKSTMVFMH